MCRKRCFYCTFKNVSGVAGERGFPVCGEATEDSQRRRESSLRFVVVRMCSRPPAGRKEDGPWTGLAALFMSADVNVHSFWKWLHSRASPSAAGWLWQPVVLHEHDPHIVCPHPLFRPAIQFQGHINLFLVYTYSQTVNTFYCHLSNIVCRV